MVQAHPEAQRLSIENERVRRKFNSLFLFCFCSSEQTLVIYLRFFKSQFSKYHNLKWYHRIHNVEYHSVRCTLFAHKNNLKSKLHSNYLYPISCNASSLMYSAISIYGITISTTPKAPEPISYF